ncbi:hypothetical protein [Sporolactobacillus shoreae]|uniref:hypothetical protein n=1 Tax=Sporolactobacillus shoreae TaxID=1465501 RepID=UPI001432BDBB|nr:hypothetical protein [Sporolactobacillus shoreae]
MAHFKNLRRLIRSNKLRKKEQSADILGDNIRIQTMHEQSVDRRCNATFFYM